eukprot:m.54599 g.54599  ORF g.54599 m.54599 type:complete len:593 (-) comp13635_c0_seq2:183-1961(-)
MAAAWELALFVLGLIGFLILSAVIYYRTGDAYKLQKRRKELGYDVDSWTDTLMVCCVLCLGPINRSRWERKHKFFRTDDYGPLDKNWMATRPASEANQEWQKLPRGDVSAAKGVAAKAIARTEAIIAQELYDHCLSVLAKEALRDQPKAKTMLAAYQSQPRKDLELAAARDDAMLKRMEEETVARVATSIDEASVTPNVAALATKAAADVDLHKRNIEFKSRAGAAPLDSYSHPHDRAALSANVKDLKSTYWRKEYRSLPLNLEDVKTFPASFEQYNRDPRMLPNKPTQIEFEPLPGCQIPGYINANAIRGPQNEQMKYIATQAPLSGREHGRKATVLAFWHMVWQYEVPAIFMLIEPQGHRCPRYWPVPEATVHHGPFSIQHSGFEKRKGYLITKLRMTCDEDGRTHTLLHYCLSGWPEHKTPRITKSFLNLVHETRQHFSKQTKPLVVHCDRGFGPTGVFIALLRVIFQAKKTGKLDCLRAVATLRQDRGALVESLGEYQFLHRCAILYLDHEKSLNAKPTPKTAKSVALAAGSAVPQKPAASRAAKAPSPTQPAGKRPPPAYQQAPDYKGQGKPRYDVARLGGAPSLPK